LRAKERQRNARRGEGIVEDDCNIAVKEWNKERYTGISIQINLEEVQNPDFNERGSVLESISRQKHELKQVNCRT
jgi:hypothetical protein